MSIQKTPVLHLVTVLWGEDYADLFCRLTLRSLLAPGNLPAMAGKVDLHYFIYTTVEDGARIKQSTEWSRLQTLATLHLESLPPPSSQTPSQAQNFDRVSTMHLLASNAAAHVGAHISFLVPDCLYSDGSIGGLLPYILNPEVPAVMTLGLRTNREGTLRCLADSLEAPDPVLQVSPRACVALALENLHEVERAMIWGENEHSTHLSHTYFRLDHDGLLAYCWHLHPILVKPGRSDLATSVGTIDGGKYLAAVVSNRDKIVVITDTDQFFSLEVSPAAHRVGQHIQGPMNLRSLAKWARYQGHGVYRQFFETPIWVHTTTSDTEQRQKQYVQELVTSAVIRPTLSVSKQAGLFMRIAAVVAFLRKKLASPPRRAIARVRAAVKRRSVAAARRAAVGLLRRSPAVRRVAVKAGQMALALGDGDVSRTLLRRQEILAIDLLRHGQTGDAEAWLRPLLTKPDTSLPELAHELFHAAKSKLDGGDLGAAQKLFSLSLEARDTPDSAFYLALVTTLAKLKAEAAERAQTFLNEHESAERFVFSAVVWGNDYIDNFMQYTVRTLFAPGNLPALSDARSYFSIVTTPSGADRIRQSSGFSLLSRYTTVVFFCFPEELTQPFHSSKPNADFYRLYGALDHTSIHFARALKAGIFFIVVDGLLSNNSISNLRRYLREGYDICANASIVSNREDLLPELARRYQNHEAIDISARDLANIGLIHRHNYITQRLVVSDNYDFDKYPRELYFPTADGLIVHALYQHPLVISARAICEDIDFDYYVVDANLMGKILDRPDKFSRLKVVTDSNDVYVANYAPAGRKFDSTGKPLDVNAFTDVHLHSLPVHHYIWEHQQLIHCDTMLRTHVDPAEVARTFLTSLRKKMKRTGRI
ncbi:hypothetical protein [Viridibacterium curvum]|uniref:Uncharacterized protein n=1 Tax=Viridibacterium curvum TaxID=1101404 RepID=A0ABP9QL50_9RHOO